MKRLLPALLLAALSLRCQSRASSAIDSDHEFDGGSRIAVKTLTKVQIENLVVLGKVWGFLKYHHPQVVAGKRHWDYELFRVLPAVLAANDPDAARAAVLDWIRGLGEIPDCQGRAPLQDDEDLQLRPDLDWSDHESLVGHDLAGVLRRIHCERSRGPQFYVSTAPYVGNPVFEHEPAYAGVSFPDAGYQLLSLYRFWNMVEYWFPYRDVLDRSWDEILAEFIPRIAQARTKGEYQLQTIALIAMVTDTHANLWSAPQLRPPAGACQLPVLTRFIEDQAVVTGYSHPRDGPITGLRIGDVIERLDGTPVQELVEKWTPYYPASNEAARLRDIASEMTRGACTDVRLDVHRESGSVTVTAKRLPLAWVDSRSHGTHDLPGETFRLLGGDVAYLKLSSVKADDVPFYIDRAKATKGLVVDIRNYPSQFVVFTLGSVFVDQTTPFVRFTSCDLDNPGAFRWGKTQTLGPSRIRYRRTVVVLVDETSQSQAEYTAMALRSAPRTIVVGSTTAGADGNFSNIVLPGDLSTGMSGIGVFYPDKRPTQRVGIVPDVEAKPTIAGVRAGRDEVLEEALRQILGPQAPQDQIESLARH